MAKSEEAEARLRELLGRARSAPDPGYYRALVGEMYRAYAEDVRAILRRRRVPESRLDDVCAATWDAVAMSLPGFGGNSAFYSWLAGIAAHKAADELRRPHDLHRDAVSRVILKLLPAPSRERPSREAARAEMDRFVRGIINQLEPDDLELLLLRYDDDLSAADIARARGLSPNTVAQRLFRARSRVKKLCKAAGIR